jgi:hypothetical protein
MLLGLSLAAKPLPGMLLALLLPRAAGVAPRPFVAALLATTALLYWPFFLWAPAEMTANLVLFAFLRPTNSSGLPRYLPDDLRWLVGFVQLALCAALVAQFWRAERRDAAALLRSAVLLTIAFTALNKVVHGNYLLWLQPLLALALAGRPFGARTRSER